MILLPFELSQCFDLRMKVVLTCVLQPVLALVAMSIPLPREPSAYLTYHALQILILINAVIGEEIFLRGLSC